MQNPNQLEGTSYLLEGGGVSHFTLQKGEGGAETIQPCGGGEHKFQGPHSPIL